MAYDSVIESPAIKPPDPYDPIRLSERHKLMRDEQMSWRLNWLAIRDFMSPRSGRYLWTTYDHQWNKGLPKGTKIINGVAFDAVRTLGAGLQGGLTSPARPWFSLTVADKSLAAYQPIKDWLAQVRDILLMVLAQSNYYTAQHICYEELGLFGTTAMVIEEDMKSVIRCRPLTIGEFTLALDSRYRPNTLMRQFSITAQQALDEYGKGDQNTLPQVIRVALANRKPETRFEVIHAIEPSTYVDPERLDFRGMQYSSCHFLQSGMEDGLLRRGGYKSMPFIAPRWAVIGVDEYGNSPGMAALGDVRMLQRMEEKKIKALDKMVDPTMNAPAGLQSQGVTLVSGGVNYLDVSQGQQGLQPAYMTNASIAEIGQEIQNIEARVKRFFYNDLFINLLTETKRMTATEVAQRHEEKLVMLGPVLERVQSEDLNVIIDRVFTIVSNFGGLPPAPPELQGRQLSVEYISTLAQAQKMAGSGQLEQFTQFVASLVPISPSVSAYVDFGNIVKEYGDSLGIPTDIVRSDAAAQQILAAQQKQQQMQQMAAQAEPMAKAAKAASATDVGGGKNVLQSLMKR